MMRPPTAVAAAALAIATALAVLVAASAPAAAQPSTGERPPAGPDTPSGSPTESAAEASPSAEASVGATAEQTSSRTAGDRSLIQEDVQPTIPVVRGSDFDVRVGGLVQVLAAPYVGDDSLVENGDPATRAGFLLRRTRLGFEGQFRKDLRIQITVNLLQTDEEVGTVSDAKIQYRVQPWLDLSLGTGKPPFARGQLESSRTLATIDRPLSVNEITPDRRLGFLAEGQVGRLAYLTGIMNGTEGFADGNEYGGWLAGGRLQYTVLGEPHGLVVDEGVVVGASAFYEDAPSTNGYAAAADVLFSMANVQMVVEGLCDTRKPDDMPIVSPTLADEIMRCGAYATGSYQLPDLPIQPAARVELYDDNTDVEDAGDVWLISGGLNSQIIDPYARAQLFYIRRVERRGPVRANDALVLSLMGSF